MKRKAKRQILNIATRYTALGPPHRCRGRCEGTGFVPVKADHRRRIFRALWQLAERRKRTDDGYHFVPCPECKRNDPDVKRARAILAR